MKLAYSHAGGMRYYLLVNPFGMAVADLATASQVGQHLDPGLWLGC